MFATEDAENETPSEVSEDNLASLRERSRQGDRAADAAAVAMEVVGGQPLQAERYDDPLRTAIRLIAELDELRELFERAESIALVLYEKARKAAGISDAAVRRREGDLRKRAAVLDAVTDSEI